jgi:hypothetical protein
MSFKKISTVFICFGFFSCGSYYKELNTLLDNFDCSLAQMQKIDKGFKEILRSEEQFVSTDPDHYRVALKMNEKVAAKCTAAMNVCSPKDKKVLNKKTKVANSTVEVMVGPLNTFGVGVEIKTGSIKKPNGEMLPVEVGRVVVNPKQFRERMECYLQELNK